MSYELVQTAENKPDKLSKFPLLAVTLSVQLIFICFHYFCQFFSSYFKVK